MPLTTAQCLSQGHTGSSSSQLPCSAHPISDPYCSLFPAKPGSFSLCPLAELWSCFLAVSLLDVHCVTALLSSADVFILSQLSFFFLFSKWLCPIFFLATTDWLLDIGLPFHLLRNEEEMLVHWDALGAWGSWENGHVATLETLVSVSDLETTSVRARWNSEVEFYLCVESW